MTKKRCIVLAGLLAIGVCLTLAVLALLPPRLGVTQANTARIEDGMTRQEVETILGGEGIHGYYPLNGCNIVVWSHPRNDTWVRVFFDDDNRVTAKEWGPQETYFQKLCNLFHL
jgi:hypothetical protein